MLATQERRERPRLMLFGIGLPLGVGIVAIFMRSSASSASTRPEVVLADATVPNTFMPMAIWLGVGVFVLTVIPSLVRAWRSSN